MIFLKKHKDFNVKDIEPMELVIQYYLVTHDCYNDHTKYLDWNLMYNDLFNEQPKQNQELKRKFNNAIEHLEEIGFIKTNNKRVDFSNMCYNKGCMYTAIDFNAYKIFRLTNETVATRLSIFKMYVYLTSIMFWQPEINGKKFEGVLLGTSSAQNICNNYGITFPTYKKYLTLLEELELLFVDHRELYFTDDTGVKILPHIYSHPKDRGQAIAFSNARIK